MSELLVTAEEAIDVPPPVKAPEGIEVPRRLGRLEGAEPGPTLILVGGLHGNEPAGVLAQQRIFATLAADPQGLDRGRLVGLAGNLKALAHKRRYLVNDLNRHWDPERVERLRRTTDPLEGEDEELRALASEIERARRQARGPVYLVDLHTTSGPRLPFATLDDTLANRKLAFEFPVPVVLGLEEELAHTLTTYYGSEGLITAGFESGQHDAPEAVTRAEAAIWIAVEACDLVARDSRVEVAQARRDLDSAAGSLPHVVEVRYRHAIMPEDWFRMNPGYENFQPVHKGESLAVDRHGSVVVPQDGLILMPLYQEQGGDGFFLVRRVHFSWLQFSAALRHIHLERTLHLLPGVERHPTIADAFVVDRHTARWLARELFHLLGFRRASSGEDRYLVMARRNHDRHE